MTSKDPDDPLNFQILEFLKQGISLRNIGKAIGLSHVGVLKRIANSLLPSGLVIKEGHGNYHIIEANYKHFLKNGNQSHDEDLSGEKNKSTATPPNNFSALKVNTPDQVGVGEKVTSINLRDPFPGKTRVHRFRYKIPLKSHLDPEQFNIQASLKDYPANIVQMANWKRVDLTFQNFRVSITTKNCFIYGIQATGSHLEETADIMDRAWQFVEPDLERLEVSLAKRWPKLKFQRDGRGIIVAEITTLEIADEQDSGATYMLRDRSYYVVRDPQSGRRKFVLDRSTGLPEVEAVDPVTGINDYENLRSFKLIMGPVPYDNLMLAVSNGYDPIRENIMLRHEMKELQDILIKDHSIMQREIDQLREMLKEAIELYESIKRNLPV